MKKRVFSIGARLLLPCGTGACPQVGEYGGVIVGGANAGRSDRTRFDVLTDPFLRLEAAIGGRFLPDGEPAADSQRTNAMLRILLLVDCANDFDRNLLRGIVRYSRENGPWLFYRLPSYYRSIENGERSILEWAKAWKADAIIGQWNDDAMDLLKELNIPVVLQNYRHRSTTYSNLTGDYEGTGLMAARFFAERLFRNFAFFGVKGVVWSDERCKGYRSEVERIGGTFHAFETGKDSEKNREVLGRWLRELPKPVALFCCDDAHALIISEICKMENISIPEDVSLLGVDNDELICNISDPPISSIELEVEKGGYAVGKLLHRQIRKEFVGPFNVVINPIRIELRQSTEKHNIEDPYVLRIVKYIERHIAADLTIDAIIGQIPLSRRNIELKFKRVMNTSIYQYVLKCRVKRFANLLLTTDLPLAEIAGEAGFRDCNNISRIFKKFMGCSPIEYRQRRSAGK